MSVSNELIDQIAAPAAMGIGCTNTDTLSLCFAAANKKG